MKILYQALNEAATLFADTLDKDASADNARIYLKNRGLSRKTIRRFGLGFCTKENIRMLRQRYTDQTLVEAGILWEGKFGTYSPFVGRVIFPIMIPAGGKCQVIAFGGRVMNNDTPKYINSSETAVFNKRQNLYGWQYAVQSPESFAILCEGYMDVIAMHQAGFPEAMASLGTALTDDQMSLVEHKSKIYLIYDSDEAGVKAGIKAARLAKKHDIPAYIVSLDPYKDPDEMIQKAGPDVFRKALKEAVPALPWAVQQLVSNGKVKEAADLAEEIENDQLKNV